MTPAQESYTTAPVAFTIAGIGLDLDGISKALGLNPTHTHRVGEVGPIGKLYQHDMWQLDSPLTDVNLDDHLKWLEGKLRPGYDFIQSLRGKADVHVYCGYNAADDRCAFRFSAEALTLLTKGGIRMDLHVLF